MPLPQGTLTTHKEKAFLTHGTSLTTKVFPCLFVSLIAMAALAQPAQTKAPERTWITDVRIISPEKLDRIEKGAVLIEDGRIARVERAKGTKKPAGATVVSGGGLFLIPGLIDSHVHLTLIPGMSDEQIAREQEIGNKYFQQLPRSYLYYGYTTVVDLGVAVNHPRLDDFKRAPQHPDLYTCGDALVPANGYPMVFYPEETRFKQFPNFIYVPSQASSIPPEYKPKDHTVAADVAAVKRSGGICVKTFYERGVGQFTNLPVIDSNDLAEIRKHAIQAGLPLILHANSFEAQKFGVEGNVDILAHGMWNWGTLNTQVELPPEIKKVLDQVVEKKVGYQPTVQVSYAQSAYFDADYLKMPAIPRVVPTEMLEWFKSEDGQSFKKELSGNNALPDATILQQYEQGPFRRERLVLAYLASKDTDFLFGTDTPSMPSYGNLPGLNGYLEMRQLQKAGLSLKQIFKAATINNAREFKLDSQLGTIEPGKIANLVLLKKSPLESVDAYDTVLTVWVHGKQISRDSLAANPTK
jgi:imidazolonepropionase-like amidohydrolase